MEAVRAFQAARADCDVTLELVSYVPDAWAAKLVGTPGLTLHTPGGPELVQGLYARSDALLFPSHMDTFGYVVLEANAWGLPVLGPAHQAVPELVLDGVTGLLFAAENPLYGPDGLARFDQPSPAAAPRPTWPRWSDSNRTATLRPSPAPSSRWPQTAASHERLAARAFEDVASGRFSMQRRRELLHDVYTRAAG